MKPVKKHHISENTKNITVNVPDWLYDALQELAKQNGMKMGAYIRQVLKDTKDKQIQFTTIATALGMENMVKIFGPETADKNLPNSAPVTPAEVVDYLAKPKRPKH
jgi:hypothetical protein